MIVVDASAIVAVALEEEGFQPLADALFEAEDAIASPINIWEAAVIVSQRLGATDTAIFTAWLSQTPIQPARDVSWTEAMEAFWRFGKGRHPAKLNMGDCFAYALAKSLDAPLLFKGADFPRTDIRSAI